MKSSFTVKWLTSISTKWSVTAFVSINCSAPKVNFCSTRICKGAVFVTVPKHKSAGFLSLTASKAAFLIAFISSEASGIYFTAFQG